jgi:hypothetical protein
MPATTWNRSKDGDFQAEVDVDVDIDGLIHDAFTTADILHDEGRRELDTIGANGEPVVHMIQEHRQSLGNANNDFAAKVEMKAQIMKVKQKSLKRTLKSWLKHLKNHNLDQVTPCSMKHHESHYMKEQHYLGWLPHCFPLIVVAPMELVMLSLMKCYIC